MPDDRAVVKSKGCSVFEFPEEWLKQLDNRGQGHTWSFGWENILRSPEGKQLSRESSALVGCLKDSTTWGTSLVAQWLRIHLPVQGTQVRALVQEDLTCCRATKPVRHNYWACALEPACHNYWAYVPRARTLQQEKPPQWEAHAPQQRVAPTHCN